MQRIGTDYRPVETILWFLALVVYEAFSTLYAYLPPLFGLMLAYLYSRNDEKSYFVVFAFLLFFEANHSLIIFSTWIYAWIFLKFIMPVAEENIVCRRCLHVLAIVVAYVGFYLFIQLFNFLLGVPGEGYEYLMFVYFMIVESLLVFVVL
jgi:hypothetical protein